VHDVRELIRDLGKSKTILLSTHILQEVRAVANRVILVNEGRLVLDGTVSDLGKNEEEMESRFRQLTRRRVA
jgi:ABC-2 type transport system ATP-binding protein